MNLHEILTRLAARARAEQAPTVDVAEQVLQRLQTVERWYVAEGPFAFVAALSSAAAACMAVASVLLYRMGTEPLKELAEAISWVGQ